MAETGEPDSEWGEKYQMHLRWLREANFLRDLECDNIDEDIIEEELSSLRHVVTPLSKRAKVVKFLRSHPVQAVLCVIVLLDACIVIAQILLDISSVKERLYRRDAQWMKVIDFIQLSQPDNPSPRDSSSSSSSDVALLLQQLLRHYRVTTSPLSNVNQNNGVITRRSGCQSDVMPTSTSLIYINKNSSSRQDVTGRNCSRRSVANSLLQEVKPQNRILGDQNKIGQFRRETPNRRFVGNREHYSGVSSEPDSSENGNGSQKQIIDAILGGRVGGGAREEIDDTDKGSEGNVTVDTFKSDIEAFVRAVNISRENRTATGEADHNTELLQPADDERSSEEMRRSAAGSEATDKTDRRKESDLFREAAQSLHIVSIAILGSLVLEDVVRISAMGRSVCRHKIEIFDAVVICTAFALDVVFIGGESGEIGQKAAAALFVLLIWRVARVVDSIIIAVKQRQEFRIRLQRRARLKAEKALESAIQEQHSDYQELEALQDLCLRAGLLQEDISSISNNRSPSRRSRMRSALTTVARLSVGVTLSSSFRDLGRHGSDSCIASIARRLLQSSTNQDSLPVGDGHVTRRATHSLKSRSNASSPEESVRRAARQGLSKPCEVVVDVIARRGSCRAASKGVYSGAYRGMHRGVNKLNPMMSRSMEDLRMTTSPGSEFGLVESNNNSTRLSISRLTGIHSDFLRPESYCNEITGTETTVVCL